MISGVVITLNESADITNCIEGLQKVCSEIIVMDTGSSDDTMKKAEQAGAKVLETPWLGYGPTKNLAHSKATHNWILSVDADEVITDELAEEINKLNLDDPCIYSINILTNYCGTWIKHSGWFPQYKPRLFPREKARWTDREVHEKLEYDNAIPLKRLQGLIRHYSYKSAEDHIQKSTRYALEGAKQLVKDSKRPSLIKQWFGPAFRFFRMYILYLGVLDGTAGFLLAKREARSVRLRYRFYHKLKNNEDIQINHFY